MKYLAGLKQKEWDKQKKRLRALLSKWKPMGLAWWKIEISYNDFIEDDTDNPPIMVCKTDWRYMDATIECNLNRIESLSDEELEYCFVHELMHIYVNEMREREKSGTCDHEERVVTQLARAMIWAVKYVKSS